MLSDGHCSEHDSHSYILQLVIKITILVGWFSTRLRRYTRLAQEASIEAAEERRLIAQKPVATTFPQFGRLPPEIRQQIWEEALPGPRALMLQVPGSPSRPPSLSTCVAPLFPTPTKRRSRSNSVNVWTCSAKIPTILHVNSEARAMALKHYRLGLAPGNSQPRIYVDFQRDVVGLSDELMQSPVGRNLWRLTDDLKEVTSLCLANATAPSFFSMRQISALDNVQEVLLVDSALWSNGVVPRVARLDWNHWVQWQIKRGGAKWGYGGDAETSGELVSRSLLVQEKGIEE
ncbi:hypothetical protein OQA88_6568 [Cercophora sp. LCS_1]